MPCYKILGIYSFADNLKLVKIDDSVLLKKEYYNVKSKNAIGVYTQDNKKTQANQNFQNLFQNQLLIHVP